MSEILKTWRMVIIKSFKQYSHHGSQVNVWGFAVGPVKTNAPRVNAAWNMYILIYIYLWGDKFEHAHTHTEREREERKTRKKTDEKLKWNWNFGPCPKAQTVSFNFLPKVSVPHSSDHIWAALARAAAAASRACVPITTCQCRCIDERMTARRGIASTFQGRASDGACDSVHPLLALPFTPYEIESNSSINQSHYYLI